MMTSGLAVAQGFFEEWALPFIQDRWPSLSDRVAVGRIFGSDVLGGDDAISRDHDWGPQFHIWLSSADFEHVGPELDSVLNSSAPNPWNGYKLAGGGDRSVYVHNVETYCNDVFHGRCPDYRCPPWEYLKNHESSLYFIRHGAVWHDPSSVFAEVQSALHFYPHRWHLERLKDECFRVWHYGEYNFVQRMVKRGDPVACAICLGEFMGGVMKLCFLAGGDYAPYWKWLAFEFRKRDEFSNVAQLLDDLTTRRDLGEQSEIVLTISSAMHKLLLEKGIVHGVDRNEWLTPLLNDHNEIASEVRRLENG